MEKFFSLLILSTLISCTYASYPPISNAQCVAEVMDVHQDDERGSIVVETQYTLNGIVVQNGQTWGDLYKKSPGRPRAGW